MKDAIEFGPIVIEKSHRHRFADHFNGCTQLVVGLIDMWMTSMKTRFIPARVLALLSEAAPNAVVPFSSRSITRALHVLQDAGYLMPAQRDGIRGYTLVRHRDVAKRFQFDSERLCMLDADYEPTVQKVDDPRRRIRSAGFRHGHPTVSDLRPRLIGGAATRS